ADVPALLRALVGGGAPARPAAGTDAAPADLAGRLAAQSRDERERTLLGLVRAQAATVLGHPDPDAIRPDNSFKELGFDSLTAVELRNRLAAATGLRLPASLVFDYPEAASLAEHLRVRLAPDGEQPEPVDPVTPLLGELARLETALGALTLDDRARGSVARRLNGLLSAVHGGTAGGDGGTGADGGTGGFAGVESASDDEIFELIDREL
ncbi:phosphopantetheine-binding protein, partial [Actinomadura roseirufa]|uniref:phosphopantetheine-binding protein n=1 Tax=Actinomadura roseirufa TaxID=2094049 RepID=UPI001F5F2D91